MCCICCICWTRCIYCIGMLNMLPLYVLLLYCYSPNKARTSKQIKTLQRLINQLLPATFRGFTEKWCSRTSKTPKWPLKHDVETPRHNINGCKIQTNLPSRGCSRVQFKQVAQVLAGSSVQYEAKVLLARWPDAKCYDFFQMLRLTSSACNMSRLQWRRNPHLGQGAAITSINIYPGA